MPEKISKNTIKNKIVFSLIWRLAERFGAQGVSLIVSIILARILEPDTYGTIALVTVLINILQVFVDSGLGSSLIQKKDTDKKDYSTVFLFNVFMSMLLYIFMWFISPVISRFYNIEQLTLVVRVLSITIIISGIRNVQYAYISRNLLFKNLFFSTVAGTLISAAVGITMALRGKGI